MARTYRYGYGSTRLTEEQLLTKWQWAMVHPEIRRRHIALFNASQDAGHDVGIGGGARATGPQEAEFYRRHQLTPTSNGSRWYKGQRWYLKDGMAPYAPPGASNHEEGVYEGYAIAIDLVGWEDHWADANVERFYLKNFGGAIGPGVNGEEWHTQPLEWPNTRSAVDLVIKAGGSLSMPLLPGETPPPPPTPPIITPIGEDTMKAIYYPGPAIQGLTDVHFAAFESGLVRHASGPDTSAAAWGKVPRVSIDGVDHFNQLARMANFMSGADIKLL